MILSPDEAANILKVATNAYHKINRKPTFLDTTNFDEKANGILVEMWQDDDRNECGILCLLQPVEEYNALTSSNLNRIGKLATCNFLSLLK